MPQFVPIIEARNQLTKFPEQLQRETGSQAVAVTRRGKPVLAILPWELYESIVETLEILGDEQMVRALRLGIREVAGGKGIAWERARKKLAG